MSDIDMAWQAAQDAAQALAPEVELVTDLDMAGFGGSLVAVLNRALEHPATLTEASLRLTANLARTAQFAAAKAMGASSPPPIEPERDKRFADVTWEDNPAFAALRQFYLATRQFTNEVLDAGRGDPVSDGKAQLAAGFLLDAFSPTNFLPTNPAALKRAFDTGGVASSPGPVTSSMTWRTTRPAPAGRHQPFHLGENMAATQGRWSTPAS